MVVFGAVDLLTLHPQTEWAETQALSDYMISLGKATNSDKLSSLQIAPFIVSVTSDHMLGPPQQHEVNRKCHSHNRTSRCKIVSYSLILNGKPTKKIKKTELVMRSDNACSETASSVVRSVCLLPAMPEMIEMERGSESDDNINIVRVPKKREDNATRNHQPLVAVIRKGRLAFKMCCASHPLLHPLLRENPRQ